MLQLSAFCLASSSHNYGHVGNATNVMATSSAYVVLPWATYLGGYAFWHLSSECHAQHLTASLPR